ncbi:hypothetical protein FB451DRAFT_1168305 [Mycena latifolia]|nr:hypothetical protein FB451DRAFT_1168305 [Mycena latifolia]
MCSKPILISASSAEFCLGGRHFGQRRDIEELDMGLVAYSDQASRNTIVTLQSFPNLCVVTLRGGQVTPQIHAALAQLLKLRLAPAEVGASDFPARSAVTRCTPRRCDAPCPGHRAASARTPPHARGTHHLLLISSDTSASFSGPAVSPPCSCPVRRNIAEVALTDELTTPLAFDLLAGYTPVRCCTRLRTASSPARESSSCTATQAHRTYVLAPPLTLNLIAHQEALFALGAQHLARMPALHTLLIHGRPEGAVEAAPQREHYGPSFEWYTAYSEDKKKWTAERAAGLRAVPPPLDEVQSRECLAVWRKWTPSLEVVDVGERRWTREWRGTEWSTVIPRGCIRAPAGAQWLCSSSLLLHLSVQCSPNRQSPSAPPAYTISTDSKNSCTEHEQEEFPTGDEMGESAPNELRNTTDRARIVLEEINQGLSEVTQRDEVMSGKRRRRGGQWLFCD